MDGAVGKEKGGRTEYKLLRRRKHIQGEGDFVLVAFALEPAQEAGGVGHDDYGLNEDRDGERRLVGFNGWLCANGDFGGVGDVGDVVVIAKGIG